MKRLRFLNISPHYITIKIKNIPQFITIHKEYYPHFITYICYLYSQTKLSL
jgi:hypothetical protein